MAKGDRIVVLVENCICWTSSKYIFLKVGNMEVDVKIREVSSWGIKVLLRNEASESNTGCCKMP